jgi:hypothetical protein
MALALSAALAHVSPPQARPPPAGARALHGVAGPLGGGRAPPSPCAARAPSLPMAMESMREVEERKNTVAVS